MNENVKLMEKFFRVGILLHRNHHPRDHEAFGDSCRGQGRVLSLLQSQPEISQKKLSTLLDIRSQSLGELLMKLERNGYIVRTPSEDDRRVMNIQLTPEGAAAAIRSEEKQADSLKPFDCLHAEEKARLNDYLDRLVSELETGLGEEAADHPFKCHRGKHGNPCPPFHPHGGGHCRHSFEENPDAADPQANRERREQDQ